MVDVNKLLSSFGRSGLSKGLLGGLAGGAVSGALMSKKGRKSAKSLLKVGGLAAVGTLAYKAYKDYQAKQQTPANLQNIPEQQFHNLDEGQNQTQSIFVLKAMVAAAMADGHIDGKEYQNILSRADEEGLSSEDKALIFDEIKQPMNVAQIAQQANSPELAMEIYTASVLAIDETAPSAQQYLGQLAQGLQLPPPLVDSVHQQCRALA